MITVVLVKKKAAHKQRIPRHPKISPYTHLEEVLLCSLLGGLWLSCVFFASDLYPLLKLCQKKAPRQNTGGDSRTCSPLKKKKCCDKKTPKRWSKTRTSVKTAKGRPENSLARLYLFSDCYSQLNKKVPGRQYGCVGY